MSGLDTRAAVALALVSLAACSERIEDSGRACLIPEQLACDCPEGEPCGPQLALWTSEWAPCTGLYPPGDDHEIEVRLRDQDQSYGWDAECMVELVGERQLMLSGSFRQRPDANDNLKEPILARCAVPALDAGTWTLHYGEGEVTFVVDESPDLQPIACVNAEPQ